MNKTKNCHRSAPNHSRDPKNPSYNEPSSRHPKYPEEETECNPDNNAFFEERSNPLSSKGN
jgi:hypothetical protein